MRRSMSAAALRALAAAVSLCATAEFAVAQTIPAPWRSSDIGAPVLNGSSTYGSGVFSVDAAGADITDTSDQFHFVYQPVTGNVEVAIRVDSLTQVSPWTNAGVMIRSSLTAQSAHAYAAVTSAKGAQFRSRRTEGATTESVTRARVAPPAWLRIVRHGAVIEGFSSSDGRTWASLGSAEVAVGPVAYVGVAVTSRSKAVRTTARLSNVTVRSLALPAGQSNMDIGAPALIGTAAFSGGAYTVRAGGAGIRDTADQFHFVYQPLTRDGEVIARVMTSAETRASARTGVMIRESLTPGARHAAVLASVQNGTAFHRRLEPSGQTTATASVGTTAGGWVRLVRRGDLFEAYRSADGSAWTMIASDTVFMAETVYVGLAASSHDVAAASLATFDSFRVATLQAEDRPPAVSLTSPATGTSLTALSRVSIAAIASDPENRLLGVDFYVGSTLLVRDTTAPYAAEWVASAAGTWVLTAVAHDGYGHSTTSNAATVTVIPPVNSEPTVHLATNATTFTAPARVLLEARAQDTDGQISRVEFFAGTTRLASISAAPYSFVWSGVAAGSYSLTAVAYDNAGASGTSGVSTITVSPAPTVPSPWIGSDIGSPALQGRATYSDGAFSVEGAGVDIWGVSDQFHFVYQPVAGDVEIVARVESLTYVRDLTSAGVMIRASLAGGSPHGYAAAVAGGGAYMRQRTVAGGTTSATVGTRLAGPVWLRLVRRGTLVTSYWSPDGAAWAGISSQDLPLGSTAYVGLAVNSGDASTLASARISQVRVGVPAANQPPVVSLVTDGSTFVAPAGITLSASAADPDGRVSRVDFFQGTTRIGSVAAAPYAFVYSGVPAGVYSFTAVAYDDSSASASSAAAVVTVTAPVDNPPRYVAFMASADHATQVTSYLLKVFLSGVDPLSATPIGTSDLAKPEPNASGEISVDRAALFTALPAGDYVATVTAIGSGGAAQSASVTFTR